ncbi:hypothetical protein MesoLjLa_24060 [Mesorhizobium sp. L-2-11]|nr:hypothetical protein MesoLjLa_24060 [Mesorhizobium sp. L-2-11]
MYDPGKVAEAQRILNELGYSAGSVDGEMGSQTRRAIINFQHNTGLRQTGRPDSALLGALHSAQAQAGLAKAPVRPSGLPDAFNTTVGNDWPQTGAPAEFTILPGYDLPNGDYRSGVTDPRLKGVSTTECQQLCAQDGQCRAFTYNERPRVCILKDKVLQQARFAGAVSGIKAGAVASHGGGPAAETGVKGGIPTLNGRLLARGPSGYPAAVSDDAVAQLGRLAVHIALERFPDILEDEDAAFVALSYLDDQSQRSIVSAAGIDPQKVVGAGVHYRHRLDEFEARALLKSIRAALPPIAATLAPDFPIPVLVLCSVSIDEYDFDRQQFPIGKVGQCNSIYLSAGLGRVSIGAPIATAYLPDRVPVPLEQARDYKQRIMGPGTYVEPMLGLEAQLTSIVESSPNPYNKQERHFAFGVEVEGALLFRHDELSQPFQKLPLIPTPSVDTIEARPTGPVPLNADTASLLLLARHAMDFSDVEYSDWASRRAHSEASGHPGPWTPFFREQVADDLASGGRPEAQLLANFGEWNRARARALPETLTLQTQNATLEWLQREALPGGARVFREPSQNSAFAAIVPRLGVAATQLFEPNNNDVSGELPGLGRAQVALVLPAAREEFTLKIDPNAKAGRDNLDVTVDVRVRDVRIDRMENQPPLVVLYVEPVKAQVTAREFGGAEVASAVFDIRHPDAATPDAATGAEAVITSSGTLKGAIPLAAETMDLLQLRHQPETVDDLRIRLMMIARHDYEQDMAKLGETPLGGWFFRDLAKPLDEAEQVNRLAEFREWSKGRANSLPETMTVSLELRNGEAPFEHMGESPRDSACQGSEAAVSQGSATEKEAMAAKLCAYLKAAWRAPEPLLYYKEHVSDSGGVGPRYDCGGERYCPEYANYYSNVRKDLGLPPPYDLIRLDRLPVLDEATRKLEGELVLEIDVAPIGVKPTAAWPDSTWNNANRRARPFDEEHGLRLTIEPDERKLAGPALIFEAKALAARVVNAETGETLVELALAAPAPLPDSFLETSASKVRNLDVLGIKLGMTFEEAERLIREHMEVGRVFKAERTGQIGLASGKIEPYSSGRLFVSRAENEAIAIFDEPPAAPGVVLGMWRRLRLPKGSIDPTGLKATLTERYGAPDATEEVFPTGANDKGVAFLWRDVKHERQDCGMPYQHEESGRWWREEAGAPAPQPSFLRHYPVFGSARDFEPTPQGADRPLSTFCPPILGVWYATYPVLPGSGGMAGQIATGVDLRVPQNKQWAEQVAKVAEEMEAKRAASESMADEIMTWLNDQRSYAKLFFESRRDASMQPAAPAKAMPKIRF